MFIQLIVLTLAFNVAILTFKNYSLLLNNSKFQDSFDDGVLNIERILKGYMIEKLEVKEDSKEKKGEIVIYYRIDNNKDDIKEKKIYFDDKNRIVLKTIKNNSKIGFNIIMNDVFDFKIIKKNNIYYLKIINLNQDERIICIWYIKERKKPLHLLKA